MRPITQETRRNRAEFVDEAALFVPGARYLQSTDQSRWLIFALAVVGVCTLGCALVAIFAPAMRGGLLQEDGIIEMASAVSLGIAVLAAGLASAVLGPRWPLVLAGFVGLAELMDETSFGARVLGFQTPALYGGGELDGFHDLLILAYRLLGDLDPVPVWIWLGLILVGSGGISLFTLKQLAKGGRSAEALLANHVLFFLHVAFIGVAQAIDVVGKSRALSAMEETLEFDAALLLVFYVVQQVCRSWPGFQGQAQIAATGRKDEITTRRLK